MQKIDIDKIGYEAKFYPRVNGSEDWFTVNRYRDALLADQKFDFPPITVVKCHGREFPYLIIDGLHRTKAYYDAERLTIPANVERIPESKWFIRSVELNVVHGRVLGVGDKAWIAKRLQGEGHSLGTIAKLMHMQESSLQKIIADTTVKISAKNVTKLTDKKGTRACREVGDDHYGFLKAPFSAFAGTASAIGVLEGQGHVIGRNAHQIVDSFLGLIEAGGIDMNDEELVGKVIVVRDRLNAIHLQ